MTNDLTDQDQGKNILEMKKQLRSERVMLLAELAKGLIAVNSGGLLALLTFIATIARESLMHPMLRTLHFQVIWSFALFGSGVVASLFIPVLLAEHSLSVRHQNAAKARRWLNCAGVAAGIGFAGIILGIAALGYGLSLSFAGLP
jgi:hypothetical protein